MQRKIVSGILLAMIIGLIVNIWGQWIIGSDMHPLFYSTHNTLTNLYLRGANTLLGGVASPGGNTLTLVYLPLVKLVNLLSSYGTLLWICIILCSGYSAYRFFIYIGATKTTALLIVLFWLSSVSFNYLYLRGLLFTQMIVALFFVAALLLCIFIDTGKKKYGLYLLLLGIFWGVIASNPGYFIPTMIALVLVGLRRSDFSSLRVKRMLGGCILLATTSLISICSFLLFSKNNVIIHEDDWNKRILTEIPLQKQKYSSSLSNTFRGLYGDLWEQWGYRNNGEVYYAFQGKTGYESKLGILLTRIPLGMIVCGLLRAKDFKFRRGYLFWLTVFIVNLFFYKSAAAPFGNVFEWLIYHVGPFGIFRSPHQKFGIVFVISQMMLLFILLSTPIIRQSIRKYFIYLLICYSVFMGYFWFQGRIVPEVNLVSSIPKEYKESSVYINSDPSIKRIGGLPYNTSTWTNTDYGYEGYTLFYYILPYKQIRNRNDIAFSSYNKLFMDRIGSIFEALTGHMQTGLLIDQMSSLNIDTIIYDGYTDRYPRFHIRENHTGNLNYLQQQGLILDKNFGKISVWRLPLSYRKPEISITNDDSNFVKINPTKYRLSFTISANATGEQLSFLQSFHSERRLYPGELMDNRICSRLVNYSKSQNQFHRSWMLSGSMINTPRGSMVMGDNRLILTHTTTTGETLKSVLAEYGYSVDQVYNYNYNLSLYPSPEELLTIILPKIDGKFPAKLQQLIDVAAKNNQMTRGSTIECARDGYTFFQGEELSYLWKQPLFSNDHSMAYDYANRRDIKVTGDILQQGLQEGWIVQYADGTYQVYLTLYFRPQSWFYVGLIMSVVLLLGLGAWFGCGTYISNKQKPLQK